MTVRIVTDSACDLPPEVVEQHGIEVVPLTIRFGTTEYVDRKDFTPSEFWRLCDEAPELPQTAAPAPGAFEAAYRSLQADGATGVVVINLSGELSATIQSATTGAAGFDGDLPIEIVDSRTITVGLGSIVMAAAEAAEAGADVAEVAALARDLAGRTHVLGALDTLEYLKRGGRIGAAQSVLGSLLSIKPLIEIKDGLVEAAGKQRTRARALQSLVDHVEEHRDQIERLSVMHADVADVDAFVERLRPFHDGEIVVGQIGAVIGTHAGPGTLGVIWQGRS